MKGFAPLSKNARQIGLNSRQANRFCPEIGRQNRVFGLVNLRDGRTQIQNLHLKFNALPNRFQISPKFVRNWPLFCLIPFGYGGSKFIWNY
jgi:hypothetical protein